MAQLMVEVKNLSKSFGDHVVLDNISFNVDEGENFVVFGRSGTGKSVLLKCIVGLLEPDKGEIHVHGKNVIHLPIDEMNEVRKKIGFLFQGSALYDSMTVRENLEFPLIRNFKFSAKEREEKVKDVLEKVGLSKAIDKKPAELSGGMKKRVGLARTIITEPELILYDEPTTGLDPITTKEISQLIVELQKDLNITAIVVTHDLICAKIVADTSIVLRAGKIRYEGEIKGLEKADDPFLKNFFSSELVDVEAGEI
ncbi:MAG TPA: ATP-binding cassette domain-containing protein [Ignavibacteriaceae bacterium]|nr:ATP-binding cassette domain-containing protein [Ignavibacteriaceae bacterium]